MSDALNKCRNFIYFVSGISACAVEGDDSCKCEKYFEGIPGQSCSKGRHNCDDSKSCYMNHQWHACCLNEEAETEDELQENDVEGTVLKYFLFSPTSAFLLTVRKLGLNETRSLSDAPTQ